jgi:hypothetical protein
VDLGGAGEHHAAFFTESRTRSLGWSPVQEIRVVILPQYPSPSGLGSRLANGPPGLEEVLGCTLHSSEKIGTPLVVVPGAAK